MRTAQPLHKRLCCHGAEDARNNEDEWKLMEKHMSIGKDLLFGLRGGVNQSIVISKSTTKKDVSLKIRNQLK